MAVKISSALADLDMPRRAGRNWFEFDFYYYCIKPHKRVSLSVYFDTESRSIGQNIQFPGCRYETMKL